MNALEIGAAVKLVIDGVESIVGIITQLHGHGWVSVTNTTGKVIVYHESQLRELEARDHQQEGS